MKLKDLKAGMLVKLEDKTDPYMVMFNSGGGMIFIAKDEQFAGVSLPEETPLRDTEITHVYDRPSLSYRALSTCTLFRDIIWQRGYRVRLRGTTDWLVYKEVFQIVDAFDESYKSVFSRSEMDAIEEDEILNDLFEIVEM